MTPEVMSPFGILMGGFCVAAVMLILWLLAVEVDEAIRKRRMTEAERRLAEYVDEIDKRHRAAHEADRRCQERARERFGR